MSLIVIVIEQSRKPKKTICCVGTKTDFSGCTVKPRESMSVTVSLIFCKQVSYVDPCRQESSMYAELTCPFNRNFAKTGLSHLVKTRGEWVKPIIKAVN